MLVSSLVEFGPKVANPEPNLVAIGRARLNTYQTLLDLAAFASKLVRFEVRRDWPEVDRSVSGVGRIAAKSDPDSTEVEGFQAELAGFGANIGQECAGPSFRNACWQTRIHQSSQGERLENPVAKTAARVPYA